MNLQELLDELRGNILRDVSDSLSSSEEDLLFSTPALVNYINDGYFKFARETRMLDDDETAAITQIALVEDEPRYALDSRVLSVRAAVVDEVWLSRQRHAVMAREDTGLARSGARRVAVAGRLFGFSTDKRSNFLQVYDAPRAADAGKTLQLTVTRLPLNKLVITSMKAGLELPEDYHLDILEWAAYRALKNHDTDGENLKKAMDHHRAFFDAVNSARREASRGANDPVQFRPTGARWC